MSWVNAVNVFKTLKRSIPISGNIDTVREKLGEDTTFVEDPKPDWVYRWLGKPFNGAIRGDRFLLVQVPYPGTRFGTLLQGVVNTGVTGSNTVELRAWVDPRAKRKLMLGYVLSVIALVFLIRTRVLGLPPTESEAVLPFILIATLPMASLGTVFYSRARNQALKRVEKIIMS